MEMGDREGVTCSKGPQVEFELWAAAARTASVHQLSCWVVPLLVFVNVFFALKLYVILRLDISRILQFDVSFQICCGCCSDFLFFQTCLTHFAYKCETFHCNLS